MKRALVLFLGIALFSGCVSQQLKSESTQDTPMSGITVGAFVGYPDWYANEALQSFPKTEFWGRALVGAELFLPISTQAHQVGQMHVVRFGLALRVDNYSLRLTENAIVEYGVLRITSVTPAFKVRWEPRGGSLGYHIEGGWGWAITSFSRGTEIKALDAIDGSYRSVSTEDSLLFTIGGGLDFYVDKNVSVSLDVRIVALTVWSDWDIDGVTVLEIDVMDASNIQVCVGLNLRF